MAATFLDQITAKMITDRLQQVKHVGVSYCNTHQDQADLDRWQDEATHRTKNMTYGEVLDALRNDIAGDDAMSEIDMAISIAAEPADLPEGCMVEILFAV